MNFLKRIFAGSKKAPKSPPPLAPSQSTTSPSPESANQGLFAEFANTNDQALLVEIAKSAGDKFVRMCAVMKITDQSLLAEVAKTAHHVSGNFMNRQGTLNDRAFLAARGKVRDHSDVRKAAFSKIIDQSVMAEIAKATSDCTVRIDAIESITDYPLLTELATTTENADVRSVAGRRLAEQNALAKIAVEDEDKYARLDALRKLIDQVVLVKIVSEDTEWCVRDAAEKRLAVLPGCGASHHSLSTLTCGGCGKSFAIGGDAVAVSLEFAMRQGKETIILSDGHAPEREDLVSSLEDVPEEKRQAALERAKPSWQFVQESLARGESRTWRCAECNSANRYPLLKTPTQSPSAQTEAIPAADSTPEQCPEKIRQQVSDLEEGLAILFDRVLPAQNALSDTEARDSLSREGIRADDVKMIKLTDLKGTLLSHFDVKERNGSIHAFLVSNQTRNNDLMDYVQVEVVAFALNPWLDKYLTPGERAAGEGTRPQEFSTMVLIWKTQECYLVRIFSSKWLR